MSGTIGILAGKGELPWIAAREAIADGKDVRVFCVTSEKPPRDFESISTRVVITKLYTSVFKAFKANNVKQLILLGKTTRDLLYDNPRFDVRSLLLLARMVSQSDTSLFHNVLREIEKQGIEVIPQDTYLKNLYLKSGRYGKALSTRELDDITFGMIYAREINRLDLGQTLVVGNLSVLAVECAEGTDQCIRRGGGLFHKKGAVVCKVAKINHDRRFDLPVTGLSTLESMKEAGCRVLAIESGRTLVLDHKAFVRQAERLGITIVSCIPEQSDRKALSKLCKKQAKV
jgi:DUF1009 family protein